MLVDTHAHAHFRAFRDDSDAVINRSLARGLVLNLVGTQRDTSQTAVDTASRFENVFASVGLHPEHLFSKHVDEAESSFISREETFDFSYYHGLAVHPKTIAIGECGLDLYRLPAGYTAESVLPRQREVFLGHIRLAQVTGLPLVIHCRDAHPELLEILKSPAAAGLRATIHCYTSTWEFARQYLDLGFYLGFTGVITFPPLKANPAAQAELLSVVEKMPLDRLLLETDCPYLAPIPHRGQRCEPWMAEFTAKKIAEVRGISYETVRETTTKNALSLFTKMNR